MKSELVDVLWHSRCPNYCINISDMIRIFASRANASLVSKNWTKKIIPLLLIKSSSVDRFWCLRCLYNRIDSPDMKGSFASGTNASLVAKIGTKDLATSCSVNRIWNNRRILTFRVSKWSYWSPPHDRIISRWRHFLHGGQKLNSKLSQPFEEL